MASKSRSNPKGNVQSTGAGWSWSNNKKPSSRALFLYQNHQHHNPRLQRSLSLGRLGSAPRGGSGLQFSSNNTPSKSTFSLSSQNHNHYNSILGNSGSAPRGESNLQFASNNIPSPYASSLSQNHSQLRRSLSGKLLLARGGASNFHFGSKKTPSTSVSLSSHHHNPQFQNSHTTLNQWPSTQNHTSWGSHQSSNSQSNWTLNINNASHPKNIIDEMMISNQWVGVEPHSDTSLNLTPHEEKVDRMINTLVSSSNNAFDPVSFTERINENIRTANRGAYTGKSHSGHGSSIVDRLIKDSVSLSYNASDPVSFTGRINENIRTFRPYTGESHGGVPLGHHDHNDPMQASSSNPPLQISNNIFNQQQHGVNHSIGPSPFSVVTYTPSDSIFLSSHQTKTVRKWKSFKNVIKKFFSKK